MNGCAKSIALIAIVVVCVQSRDPMRTVEVWNRFELRVTASGEYANPVQDVSVDADFVSPSGRTETVQGFWDGGRLWKVRFSPDVPGRWSFRTRCSRIEDAGLNGAAGEFECLPYRGPNGLYAHGSLRRSTNGWYLIQADGTPFFWLGDTAWNGPLLSSPGDWEKYLRDRESKGFNAVQFVTTQWIAAVGDADGRTAYRGQEPISVDPAFYQRLDARIDAINEHGMIAAPVMIWDTGPAGLSPGVTLPDDQLVVLARYLLARYGAHQVLWILAGDGDYRGRSAERWKQIGRAVFGAHPRSPVTMHPAGLQWVWKEFAGEPWFGLNGYQSSHGGTADTFRWLCDGPPARDWQLHPPLPSINLEPNYEGHHAFGTSGVFDAHSVRRAAYWSVLAAPPAGVSYGAHGVWSWESSPATPLHHSGTGIARPWFEAIHFPGSAEMKHLRDIFASLPWWTLRPAPELLVEQPGSREPERFVSASLADDGSWALLYTPEGGPLRVHMDLLPKADKARWYNPRTGEWSTVRPAWRDSGAFQTPDEQDWALWIGRADWKR